MVPSHIADNLHNYNIKVFNYLVHIVLCENVKIPTIIFYVFLLIT